MGLQLPRRGNFRSCWRELGQNAREVTHVGAWYTCACLGYGSMCDILPGLWVIFCEFGPSYGSALQSFTLVIGK